VFVSFKPPDSISYSYLLGVYLGDGCLTGRGRCKQLVIVLDQAYPEIIEDCWAAMNLVLPGCHVGLHRLANNGGVRVVAASSRWTDVFPQHGPGLKHRRPIVLEPWQREIVDAFLREFLRGLFCEYCERLGIRWTQSNHRNISVSHRHSVALLDEFVGPKR
jgi:hypothetical protein